MQELHEAVANGMRSNGVVGRGPWTGAAAEAAITAAADVTESVLRSRLSTVNQLSALSWAASAMALSQELQATSREKLKPSPARAVAMNFHSENAMAARVVLEMVVRSPSGSGSEVDEITAIDLAKLGHQVWRWKLLDDRRKHGLCRVAAVALKPDGTFDVSFEDQPPFSLRCFETSYMSGMSRGSNDDEDADVRLMEGLVRTATEDGDLPADLVSIDAGLRESRGYGLAATLAALSFLARWAGRPDENLAGGHSTAASLAEHAVMNVRDWYPHIQLDELQVALRWLTWTQELIQETPLALHRHRDVPARLYSRPVVELGDRSVFVVSGAPEVAMHVLALRLVEGTWSEQLLPSDAPLKRALEQRRALVRPVHGFERDVESKLLRLGLPFATSVAASPIRPSPRLGVVLRREIDAVVVDPRYSAIWVVEAKDLAYPFEARRIRSELDKYFRPRGHVEKLRDKCDDVRRDAAAVAATLGVAKPADWGVFGLFVTREPSPASCDARCPFPFVLLRDLEKALRLSRHGEPTTGSIADG